MLLFESEKNITPEEKKRRKAHSDIDLLSKVLERTDDKETSNLSIVLMRNDCADKIKELIKDL